MVAVKENENISKSLAGGGFSHVSEGGDTLETVFHETLSTLKRKLSLFVWQGFFEPLKPVSFQNYVLTLAAPSLFHRDWVLDHYHEELEQAAYKALGKSIRIQVIQGDESLFKASVVPQLQEEPETSVLPLRPTQPVESAAPSKPALVSIPSHTLNPNYIFDSFVPGPSNQMAFAACNAVAEQPGNQYSPLFLFGPVGLGKTHLLHAIGLAAQKCFPHMRVLYMSAEQWVNDYIQAIRERRFEGFRKRFRSECDILLIDDIQFLAGKDASQDEFFHTFNTLHQAHKQIVVTSDKYPHEIEGLEERLKTRLSWGLIADIRPPEMETRIAILHRKAEVCHIQLPDEVAHFLASQITTSVRELEGALIRLSAFASVTQSPITLQQAKDYLSPMFKKGVSDQVSSEKICEIVASYYELRPLDLKGQSRQKQVAVARQIAMSLCRSHLLMSMPEIGRLFGGRDHTTVLASLRKIDELKETDIGIHSVLVRFEKMLMSL